MPLDHVQLSKGVAESIEHPIKVSSSRNEIVRTLSPFVHVLVHVNRWEILSEWDLLSSRCNRDTRSKQIYRVIRCFTLYGKLVFLLSLLFYRHDFCFFRSFSLLSSSFFRRLFVIYNDFWKSWGDRAGKFREGEDY